MPATTIRTSAAWTRSMSESRRWRPATPTSESRVVGLPKSWETWAASWATGRSRVPAERTKTLGLEAGGVGAKVERTRATGW